MKYSNQELVSSLAAEYVLGTLRGKARVKFETLRASRKDVQEWVWYWESQLNQIGNAIPPIEPSPKLWDKISSKIEYNTSDSGVKFTSQDIKNEQADSGTSNRNVTQFPKSEPSAQPKSSPWKLASGFAVAACLVLAILLVSEQQDVKPEVTSLAIVLNEESKVLWSIDVLPDRITVKTTQNLPVLSSNDYQLWVVAKTGGDPIPIALLPQRGESTINATLPLAYSEIAAIAVSKEPIGGSPTGKPTEVLYITDLILINS